jgi:hypothetical protein
VGTSAKQLNRNKTKNARMVEPWNCHTCPLKKLWHVATLAELAGSDRLGAWDSGSVGKSKEVWECCSVCRLGGAPRAGGVGEPDTLGPHQVDGCLPMQDMPPKGRR